MCATGRPRRPSAPPLWRADAWSTTIHVGGASATHQHASPTAPTSEQVVLLYPAEDALTPAQCAAMAHRTPAQCAARAGRGAPGSGAAAAPPEGYAGINTGAPLELIVVDGTWQQAKVLAKRVPPSVPRVALAAAPQRSLFGSSLREQSAEREAQGRVCTVEAVGMLALQMGEPPEEVEALLGYLATFIGACVPTVRRVRRREHSH